MKTTLNVLIIEDSVDDTFLLERSLRSGGYDLNSRRVDTTGALAKALGDKSWDLVIADYSMPKMTWMEAIEMIKEAEVDAPVIIVSGAISEDAAVSAMRAGACDYIVKDNLARLLPAVERELREAELRREKKVGEEEILLLNRLLETIFEIDKMIVREQDPDRLLSEACRILVEKGGLAMAWIGIADFSTNVITPVASAGTGLDYLEKVVIRCDDSSLGRGPSGTAVRTGSHVVCTDMLTDKMFTPWRDVAAKYGFRSCASVPLFAAARVIGCVNVYSQNNYTFGEKMLKLLDDLSGDIGFAMHALEESRERRKAEERLRESEERFRQLFEQNEDAMMLVDARTFSPMDVNPAAVKLYGYSREELMEQGHPFFDAEDVRMVEQMLGGAEEGGGFFAERMNATKKDGTRIVISLSSKIIKLRDAAVIFCTMRDMTKIVRMEEEARIAQARLIHANKMASLGTLASGVAHEVNNPNNFIMFNAVMLQDCWRDSSVVLDGYYRDNGDFHVGGLPYSEMRTVVPELLSGIADGARRIKNIVDNLKGFSRTDDSNLEASFDVNEAVKAAASILKTQVNKYTDNFSLSCADDLPMVKGNEQKIEQVVINLILNSLHALPDKDCAVRVSTSLDRDENMVVIVVDDEGTGMTGEVLERITEPFFTTRAGNGGTGLGLSISYAIIKEHNGILDYSSLPGAGTTAVIKLPAG